MLYWIQILPPIGGATSMDFFTIHIACLIAAYRKGKKSEAELRTVHSVLEQQLRDSRRHPLDQKKPFASSPLPSGVFAAVVYVV